MTITKASQYPTVLNFYADQNHLRFHRQMEAIITFHFDLSMFSGLDKFYFYPLYFECRFNSALVLKNVSFAVLILQK